MRDGDGFAVASGENRVEHRTVSGAIHAGLEGSGADSETQFAGVEAIAEKPAAARVAIGNHHFGERSAVQNGANAAALFVAHGVQHQAFARVEPITETPLLPAHFAVFDLKAGAAELKDIERRGSQTRRAAGGQRKFTASPGDRDIAAGVEKVDNSAGGQIDVCHQALNRMGVEILTLAQIGNGAY